MKKLLRLTFLSATLMTAINGYASAQQDAEKIQLIDTLLAQSGQTAVAVGKQLTDLFVQQMEGSLRAANPDVDPRAFKIISEEVNGLIDQEVVAGGVLTEPMHEIYSKYYSVEELKQIVAFNKTPLGQKILKVTPAITQEGMKAGQAYGQALAPRLQEKVMARFQKEGINPLGKAAQASSQPETLDAQ